jgi:uncharacterized protein (TIGR02271 family)
MQEQRQDSAELRSDHMAAESPREITPEDAVVIPVVVEALNVTTEPVVRGVVRVNKRVQTVQEVVETPTSVEAVTVERVPINAFVEGAAPEVREEDGVVIIPVLEEVLVVEKRLFLREEVRLTKHVTAETSPHTVSLRREVVEIERIAPDGLQNGGSQAKDLLPQNDQGINI